MKKLLAVLALAVFIGGVSAPAFAVNENVTKVAISVDDPKDKKADKKSSKDCQATKSDCTSKKSDTCNSKKKSSETAKK